VYQEGISYRRGGGKKKNYFFYFRILKDHIIDPDEIVIKEQVIKIEFSYPLKRPTVREYIAIGGAKKYS